MTKQQDKKDQGIIKKQAADMLNTIARTLGTIEQATINYNAIVEPVTATYNQFMTDMQKNLADEEKKIISLMKKNKGVLFAEADVVNLIPGSLIRNEDEKVTIPKTALQACKDNGFKEVIKIVESLDRPAIEKWPDAKLVLIGAERKQVEEFSFDLRKTVNSVPRA
jgi:hypothetical protein